MSDDDEKGGGGILHGATATLGILATIFSFCARGGDDIARGVTSLGRADDALHGARAVTSSDDVARELAAVSSLDEAAASAQGGAHTSEGASQAHSANRATRGTSTGQAGAPDHLAQLDPEDLRRAGREAFQDALRAAEQERVAGGRLAGERIQTRALGVVRASVVDPGAPVRDTRLVSLFPADENQFRHVYGRAPTVSEYNQLTRLQLKFAASSGVRRFSNDDALHLILAEFDAQPAVILAHSEDGGRTLVLPNGHRISSHAVHEQCLAQSKACLIVTCNGEDLAISGQIAPHDAFAMWDAARVRSQSEQLTIAEFAMTMRRDRINRQFKRRVTVSGVGLGTAGIVYVYTTHQEG